MTWPKQWIKPRVSSFSRFPRVWKTRKFGVKVMHEDENQLTVSKSSSSSSFTSFSEKEEEEDVLTLRRGQEDGSDQHPVHSTYWWSGRPGPSCSPPCPVHPGRPGSCTLDRRRHRLPLWKQTGSVGRQRWKQQQKQTVPSCLLKLKSSCITAQEELCLYSWWEAV